jgi:hypothetical protein
MEVRMNRFFKVSVILAISMIFTVAALAGGCCKSGEKAGCQMMNNVTKTATNIENGVTMTIVGKTPEAVKAIQEKMAACKEGDKCKMEGVKREIKNTENGAVITMTSDDAKTVKKLQKKAAKCASGKCSKGCCSSEKKEGCSKEKKAGCSAEQQKSCGHAK